VNRVLIIFIFLRGFFLKVCCKVSSFAFEIPNHIKDHETPRRCQFDLKFCYDLYFYVYELGFLHFASECISKCERFVCTFVCVGFCQFQ